MMRDIIESLTINGSVFVIQTSDTNFKDSLSEFLTEYCKDKGVIVNVFEMNEEGADKVMKVVLE